MGKELLDLTLVVDRPTVRIRAKAGDEGTVHELLGADELSPFDIAYLQTRNQTAIIDPAKKPTAAQEAAQRKSLLEVVAIVAPSIDKRTRTRMPTTYLLAIYLTFLGLIDQGGDEGNAPGAPTGGASSRGSRRSTAATRKRGSARRSTS